MFPEILSENESKVLEFKENTKSAQNIIKTVIAFANTAGGMIIIGVEDKTKKIIGVENILQEEERLTSIIADSIEPMLLPDIEVINYLERELLVINVPYLAGVHYHKQAGINNGTYVRLGSTNRLADNETITELLRAGKNISFDETPCIKASIDELDDNFITKTLKPFHKQWQKKHYESLNFITTHNKKNYPTYGALLLFSQNRIKYLPDSGIHCVCYAGNTREKIIDKKEITSNLIIAVNEAVAFIERHSNLSAKFGKVTREDIPQFPSVAIREAVVNAIVHADYSISGSSTQIAVFADRIEITNPGTLPFGQSLESALSGVSKMRNRVLGRVFRELKIIERLGSGIPRIFESYAKRTALLPKFEEINHHFRVTLFEATSAAEPDKNWERDVINALEQHHDLATKEIAALWKVSVRTARIRLKEMMTKGLIQSSAQSKTDPTARYKLFKPRH